MLTQALKQRPQSLFHHGFLWCLRTSVQPIVNLLRGNGVNDRASDFNFYCRLSVHTYR
jgi:hypothetical protein